MSKPEKVYNKGTRPIVFKHDLTGTDAIQPGKFIPFEKDKATALIKKHENACSEVDYEKRLKEVAEKQAEIKKKAEIEAEKKTKTKSGK